MRNPFDRLFVAVFAGPVEGGGLPGVLGPDPVGPAGFARRCRHWKPFRPMLAAAAKAARCASSRRENQSVPGAWTAPEDPGEAHRRGWRPASGRPRARLHLAPPSALPPVGRRHSAAAGSRAAQVPPSLESRQTRVAPEDLLAAQPPVWWERALPGQTAAV